MMQLYQGDCLEVMKQIPDKSVDMILTDPPYGITDCHWDSVVPMDKMWRELIRVVKNDGAICICATEPFASHLRLSNKNWRYDWLWIKERGTGIGNSHRRPLKQYENICVFYNKQPFYDYRGEELDVPYKRRTPRVKSLSSGLVSFKITDEKKEYKFKTKTNIIYASRKTKGGLHPTAKPVVLMEKLITTYTKPGQIVLDCFMGSGTTGVACKHLNRNFIGIELDEHYFEIAKNRIENEPTQLTLTEQKDVK